MKLSVSFPIKNEVFIRDPFPISVGAKSYFLKVEGEVAKEVSVTWTGVSPQLADQIEGSNQKDISFNIETTNSRQFLLLAEYDIRAWQSLLTPYTLIDIDFDAPTTSFMPENVSEAELIKVHSSSVRRHSPRVRGKEAFEIYGRAFLAIDRGREQVELMAHYRDAYLALQVGRSIDAYNGFYLFIESQFCRGRTGTQAVVRELMKHEEFVSAISRAVTDFKAQKRAKSIRLASVISDATTTEKIIEEIVELRGALRHHSLGSPNRWDPNKQEKYDVEAGFIAQVCFNIAFPKTTLRIWDSPYVEQFMEQAKSANSNIELSVIVTLRRGDQAAEQRFGLNYPQAGMDAPLARTVLDKILEIIDKQAPDGEIFAIRVHNKRTGTELLRYDVGPTLHR